MNLIFSSLGMWPDWEKLPKGLSPAAKAHGSFQTNAAIRIFGSTPVEQEGLFKHLGLLFTVIGGYKSDKKWEFFEKAVDFLGRLVQLNSCNLLAMACDDKFMAGAHLRAAAAKTTE